MRVHPRPVMAVEMHMMLLAESWHGGKVFDAESDWKARLMAFAGDTLGSQPSGPGTS